MTVQTLQYNSCKKMLLYTLTNALHAEISPSPILVYGIISLAGIYFN